MALHARRGVQAPQAVVVVGPLANYRLALPIVPPRRFALGSRGERASRAASGRERPHGGR